MTVVCSVDDSRPEALRLLPDLVAYREAVAAAARGRLSDIRAGQAAIQVAS